MANGSDLFMRMSKEAMEEIASGEKGWREMDANVLFLACFGMVYNHLSHKIVLPIRWFAGAVTVAVIGYLVEMIMSHGI